MLLLSFQIHGKMVEHFTKRSEEVRPSRLCVYPVSYIYWNSKFCYADSIAPCIFSYFFRFRSIRFLMYIIFRYGYMDTIYGTIRSVGFLAMLLALLLCCCCAAVVSMRVH